jgi:cyanophycinase
MKTKKFEAFVIGGQPVAQNFRTLFEIAAARHENGHQLHVGLIAHATNKPITGGAASAEDFLQLGAKVTVITPGSHKTLPTDLDLVWMRGGDQSLMIEELKRDGLYTQIIAAAKKGILIGGNSAGTASLVSKMIAGGMGNDKLIACDQLEYGPGLGLIDGIILDTHVDSYVRWTRLMAICAENPGFIVVGLDESTAVYIEPEGAYDRDGAFIIEVSGTSHVYIVSQGSRFSTNLNSCERGEGGRRITGLEFDVFSHGDRILIPASRKASDIKLLKAR